MRYAINYALAASLVASAAAAAAGRHGHQHFHAKKEASPVEKREPDVVTEIVAGPTQTVYELDGELLDADEAKDGINGGNFIVIGETRPTFTPPPPPPPPSTTATPSSSSADVGAQFIESPSTTSTAPPPPPPSTSSAAPSPSPSATSSPVSGGQGLDSEFPDKQIDCSNFPEDYGAVPLPHLDFDKWSGIQQVPDFSIGALSISNIVTAIAGQGCTKNSMCSYACPPGYQKTQWPEAQGSTRQSIGGLFCNSNGKLELTRPSFKTLCEPGTGGVEVINELQDVVSICRTDYPGTESMVIPSPANPGSTVNICNPDQTTYYQWDQKATTAQYYVNQPGVAPEDACVWNCANDPKGCGNWAPLILGTGRAADGNTYVGLFQNLPESTAVFKANAEILVGDSTEPFCSFVDGQWTGGSSGSGCTASFPSGGKVTVRFY